MGVDFNLTDDLCQNSGLLREWEAAGMDSWELKQELKKPQLGSAGEGKGYSQVFLLLL